MRALFVALCRSRGLSTSCEGSPAAATTVRVRAPDELTQLQLWSEYDELLEDFREVVFAAADGFARERVGVPLEME